MRPIRLELAGFGSFRDYTIFDFDGIDFFALVGPTGNGKSTVIDAIGFALYGKVPRHDDRSTASSVVSLGAIEARVRLTFDAGGVRYIAVRTVKLRNGKPKQDVRLETADGSLLAGQVREFTEAMETILGMPFEDFTRCVALPQGEFQKFLHEDPKHRRSVLVRLLNLGHYEDLGRRARERASALNVQLGIYVSQCERLVASLTDEAELTTRLRNLQALSTAVAEALPVDRERATHIVECERSIVAANSAIAKLHDIAMPDVANELGANLVRATEREADAARMFELATGSLADLESQFESATVHGDIPTLERVLGAHVQLDNLQLNIDTKAAAASILDEQRSRARTAAEHTERARRMAEDEFEKSKYANRSHVLRQSLEAGDTCPVCLQVVDSVPVVAEPEQIRITQRAFTTAVAAHDQSMQDAAKIETELAAATSALDTLREQQLNQRRGIPSALTRAVVAESLVTARALERELRDARLRVANAAKDERTARALVQQRRDDIAELQSTFDRQRDAVAALDPPPRNTDDFAAGWRALTTWAQGQLTEYIAVVDAARIDVEGLAATRASDLARLNERATMLGVAASDLNGIAASLAASSARTEAAIEHTQARRAEVATLEASISITRGEQQVAELLGKLLRTDAFVEWLVEEALTTLISAASHTLFELSGGQYSLRHGAATDFEIIDHTNADAARSVRSLSGGETFQASLALALALSDQLAELAAHGAPKLEAIFLDEGFGTLDPESLDTVACTIEALGKSGRMVGIVTHVRDLAQRVPVRFEITKVGNRSQVEVVSG